MNWNVRLVNEEDLETVSKLAEDYRPLISPYVLNPTQIKAYMDEWLVAESEEGIGGALHFVTQDRGKEIRNRTYLRFLKQVDLDVIIDFFDTPGVVFMSQPTCPGKGSLRVLVDYLKGMEGCTQLWSWLSIVSPVIRFYEE